MKKNTYCCFLMVWLGALHQIVLASDTISVCITQPEELEAEPLFLCGNYYKSGDCGFDSDFNSAISFYEKAGDKGFVLGYSTAAWMMLHQGIIGKNSKRFEELIQKGRKDQIGLSNYLNMMTNLAAATSPRELQQIFQSLEVSVYNDGLPANLLAMYFMLENSECASLANDDLVRQQRLIDAMRYSKPFSLNLWNEKVDKQGIDKTLSTILVSINPKWKKSYFKGDWCKSIIRNRAD